jgi:predicted NAD/FAD-dependent oxidoreductase
VAVVGGGIAGLTCASRLAQSGCQVTVYETGRGPGGRTSTRQTRDPEKHGWQWDHGAQYITCKAPAFQDVVEEWRAAGCVAEWTGRFGVLDAATGRFTLEEEEEGGKKTERWVGTPGMSAITAHLAKVPGVTVVSSRRVTGFEGGPGSIDGTPDGAWTVVHRSSGPAPADEDGNPAPQPPATRDGGFAAVVAADKQAASDRSRRVYKVGPLYKLNPVVTYL